MIGNIAHQWRQPLSAITTISTGLKLQLEMGIPLSSDENIENLNKINEQAQYLSRTIEDFRGFFSTKLTEVVDFEVSEAIEKVNDLTKDSFRNNFIEVNYDMDKEIYIESNKNLLIQALLNIYNNALDALKEREKDRLFFISAKKEDNNIVIKIKDNAGGIPLDYIEKIFDPYFTTKHQSQGTGIGLYMTHQIIVKQLQGTISVDNTSYTYNNENHLGAEFTIKISSL
ncbi:sensor histidine kinase [Halarcobacter sp.]|uniref:sensor histidine kinase n=1 Tax=Halarcobacter sp. TaxID=2321133 RepID=UPI003A8F72E0